MNAFTKEDLKIFQAESLDEKFQRSLAKISEWFSYWNNEVYVAFSGGKDSTVLADICARWCKVIGKPLYLVFVNTGLEYPEIQKFVKEYAEYLRNKYDIEVVLEILRPKLRFDEVIKIYGYPLISKEISKTVSAARRLDSKFGVISREKLNGTHKMKDGNVSLFNCSKYKPLLDVDFEISDMCCSVMKKKPSHEYAKRTGRKCITAQMADESRLRTSKWLKNGCNGFNLTTPVSNPMSFWTEQDVFQYIKEEQLPIASVYGDIVYAEDSKQMRIEDYGIDCGGKEQLRTTGCNRTGCIFCAFGCHLEKEPSRFQRLKETHPRQYEYCIGGILLAYKFFGKTGLFVWIGFATVAANIEVSKCVDMFGLSVTLGNVIYGTTFLATDILSEKYGGREARKGVLIGFFTTVAFTLMSQVNLLFIPNSEDVVSEAMKTVFSFMPRICIASVIAYLISNTLDTFTYDVIRKHCPNHLWLRNNGSTLTSQLLDSFLFTILAFAGVFDWLTIIELSLTTYAIKIIVAACDTPFLYIAKHIKE